MPRIANRRKPMNVSDITTFLVGQGITDPNKIEGINNAQAAWNGQGGRRDQIQMLKARCNQGDQEACMQLRSMRPQGPQQYGPVGGGVMGTRAQTRRRY